MNDTHHRLALPQGTRIQDFEFHRVLGQGGFGITYLGWNIALDIPVAVKEYLPSDLATREYDLSVVPQSSQIASDFKWGLDRFIDEARILARFHHPNIVRVHHFFQAHSTAYIVMEYAEGETLSAFLERKGTLKEAELKAILYPLLDGLEVVHRADFLHRDIKPGNIIIRDEDNSPVLLDFGSARQAIGTRSRSVTSIITPGYAPIEQYSSRGDQGPWTDIYALGGVCYRALTGEVPDDATERVRHDPLIPVVERCVGQASAGFLSAIDWALAVDEGDRPQSVAAWRVALEGEVPGSVDEELSVTRSETVARSEVQDQERDDAPPVHHPTKSKGKLFVAFACVVALWACAVYYYHYEYLPDQRRQAQEAKRERQAVEEKERRQAKIVGYERKFEEGLGRNDLDMADRYVDSLRAVNASASVLSEIEGQLSAARKAEQRRREQRVGRTFRDCPECPLMAVVPSGSFTMGSPREETGRDDEGPRYAVRIDYRFAVGVYEVSFDEWDACANAGGCNRYVPDDEGWGRRNRPVINVSWEDVQSYVRWLSERTGHEYRLLSESEWEYVARAGTDTRYSWGNEIGLNRANCSGCGSRWDNEQTAPVGSFSANAWGVYDMHGNVWEWVEDCYNDSYVGAPSDGSAWKSGNCSERVLRGGSRDHQPWFLRSANRFKYTTEFRYDISGFRVARRFYPGGVNDEGGIDLHLAAEQNHGSVKIYDFPQGDLPDKKEKEEYKSASVASYKFYYGIGRPIDYRKARYAAFVEFEQGNPILGGASVLMMLYANGFGVERDLDLSIKLARLEVWGAPAAIEGRIAHLEDLKTKSEVTPFDLCDDITSGFMMGVCKSILAEKSEAARKKDLRSLIESWSLEHQKAFITLMEYVDGFNGARSKKEIEISGSARAVNTITEEEYLSKFLLASFRAFEEGFFPQYTRADFIEADKALNQIYSELRLRSLTDEFSFGERPGFIQFEDVREVQRLWIKYRDAWVQFGSVKYPQVSPDSWKTWLTNERIKQLNSLGGTPGINPFLDSGKDIDDLIQEGFKSFKKY